MKFTNALILVGMLGMVTACSTSKKNTKTTTTVFDPFINLDTINIVANEAPINKTYQATHTKSSDIIHTKLWVNFDWKKSQLHGKAELHIKPYFYPTHMLYLNARGMEITSVKLFEKPSLESAIKQSNPSSKTELGLIERSIAFVYENDSLKINLGKTYTAQESYYITVEYISKPNELKQNGSVIISDDKGLFFINPLGTDSTIMPQVWTQGETQSNSAWFPTIDNPTEKMTTEISMTVDDKYTTLSNGLLTESTKNKDGTRTDYWEMNLPHSPYLVMMAVGEFKKVMDEPWNGKEISYYVEREYVPHAKAIFGKTKKMIEFYSHTLGVNYPWQKYAQLVARNYVSGAMENTSATLHGDFMVYQTSRETLDGLKGETTIAHELFHQWFGDLVTTESWSNLTLNESFATYGEYLWEEFEYGRDAADAHQANSREGYFSNANTQVNLVRFNYTKRDEMFDATSYNKGGQILHMLRKYVGDDAFFAALKLYLETYKYQTAEAHDLRLVFEKITGEDLNWFFNQWYFDKGHPELAINKSYDAATKTLQLDITQEHNLKNAPLYKLPIYVDIYVKDKKIRQQIWIQDFKNTYKFKVDTNPVLVNIDAERQLLAKTTYNKSTEEYLYQYKHAALWGDRDEAINYFKQHGDDKEVYELLKFISQKDAWWKIRTDAVDLLSKQIKHNDPELKSMFISIFEKDTNTRVRAAAIKALSQNYSGEDLNIIFEKTLQEKSYAIVSAGLEAISQHNWELAIKKAATLEDESNKELIYIIANLYATKGSDKQHAYFKKIKSQFTGYELMGYCNIYGIFLSNCKKPENVIEGATALANISKTDNQYVKYTAQKVIKDLLLNTWQKKEDEMKLKIDNFTESNKDTAKLKEELNNISEIKRQILVIYNSIK